MPAMELDVLAVDDSAVARKVLKLACEKIEGIRSVQTATGGGVALMKLENFQPGLILLDINMPQMDGIQTLTAIHAKFPKIPVVMVSGVNERDAAITLKALQQGAMEFVPKPQGDSLEESIDLFCKALSPIMSYLRGCSTRTLAYSPAPVSEKTQHQSNKSPLPSSFSALAIGVSTGGPEALKKLLPLLSGSIPVPIYLVQHMPPKFTRSLAISLDKSCVLTVLESEDGMVPVAGTVYIAAGGTHTTVYRRAGKLVLRHENTPPENSCRPAVDVLFRSLREAYSNSSILSVILTGMGSDGCKGVAELKKGSAYCITQSSESCTVYGMPRAVDEAGLSDLSLPPEQIAERINHMMRVST